MNTKNNESISKATVTIGYILVTLGILSLLAKFIVNFF